MQLRKAFGPRIYLAGVAFACALLPRQSRAQAADPTGSPPPDAEALVSAPVLGTTAPEREEALNGTTVGLSSGGMLTTGNSRSLAASANGSIETRFDANGLGFSLLGNYARGAA